MRNGARGIAPLPIRAGSQHQGLPGAMRAERRSASETKLARVAMVESSSFIFTSSTTARQEAPNSRPSFIFGRQGLQAALDEVVAEVADAAGVAPFVVV